MNGIPDNSAHQSTLRGFATLTTLTLWRFRQNGALLALLQGGMLCAVLLVCTAPLFSQVALTAGIRAVLQQTPNAYVSVTGGTFYRNMAQYPTMPRIQQAQQQITSTVQKHLGTYIDALPQLLLTSDGYYLPTGVAQPHHPTGGQMLFQGFDIADIAAHVKLLQGHLPQPDASALEIAVLPQVAQQLQMTIGDTIAFPLNYGLSSNHTTSSLSLPELHARLVGIFTINNETDAVWHDSSFETDRNGYHVLVSLPGMVSTFEQLERTANAQGALFSDAFDMAWYYHLDAVQMDVNHVQTLLNGFAATANDIDSHPNLASYVFELIVYDPHSTVSEYQSRITTAQIPERLLLLLIAALFVIFLSSMSEVLAEQQALQVAILHSRGASRRQLFVTVGLQSLLLGLIALLAGPWLAFLLAHLLTFRLLPTADWGALNVLDRQAFTQVVSVLGIAALMDLVAIVSTLLASNTSATANLLSLRRESSRSQTRPLWMRLGLDVIIACMGLACYGCFLYVLNSGALNQQSRVLLLSPLLLLTVFLLLLAGCLGFLRLFPRLLAWIAGLAARGRSATAMLAFAQIARAPRQSLRQILLLALAIAFMLFTQVFLASQWQRLPAVAAYQAGADFSGERVTLPAGLNPSLQSQTLPYRRLPGVFSATLGSTDIEVGAGNTVVEVQAVDAQSYATSVDWSPQDIGANLSALTRQLSATRQEASTQHILPAIVDAATWQALHLSLHTPFILSLPDGSSLTYLPIAQVQHLPTITSQQGVSNGLLVDYQSYSTVYSTVTNQPAPLPSWVWLRTTNHAASLAAIRAALTSGPLRLSPLYDRRQLLVQLQQDPLLLALVGLLVVGAIVPLVFALGGSVVAFWLGARARLTNVAVLRALGSTPREVSQMLLWEQGLIYSAALLLGLLFGGLLTIFALPALIFSSLPPTGITSTGSTSLLYALQSAPPVRISIPPFLGFSTLGLGVLIVITFVLMTSTVLQPTLAQMLRLNED